MESLISIFFGNTKKEGVSGLFDLIKWGAGRGVENGINGDD